MARDVRRRRTMMIALGLTLLVATTDGSATHDSKPAQGAALGAMLGAGLSGLAMFGALFVAIHTSNETGEAFDARHATGDVPFVAAVALASIASSAIGAGAGYAIGGGEVLDAPAAMGGAMMGATLGSAAGAVPAAFAFASADATLAQSANNFGDAIGSGLEAGSDEAIGFAASLGASLFLAPPAAGVGAYLVGDAVSALDE